MNRIPKKCKTFEKISKKGFYVDLNPKQYDYFKRLVKNMYVFARFTSINSIMDIIEVDGHDLDSASYVEVILKDDALFADEEIDIIAKHMFNYFNGLLILKFRTNLDYFKYYYLKINRISKVFSNVSLDDFASTNWIDCNQFKNQEFKVLNYGDLVSSDFYDFYNKYVNFIENFFKNPKETELQSLEKRYEKIMSRYSLELFKIDEKLKICFNKIEKSNDINEKRNLLKNIELYKKESNKYEQKIHELNAIFEKHFKRYTGVPKKKKKDLIRNQMDMILDAIRNGKSREDAAKQANIPPHRIVHWYNEGKNRYGEDNIYFYKNLKKIESVIDSNDSTFCPNCGESISLKHNFCFNCGYDLSGLK